ncbi:MAG: cadherin-like beta sandwich domain-containing protein [Firmicutes bacterium]|nr:cadherin-like beta sandwich domain-containing protein [Bacillota bacterium]
MKHTKRRFLSMLLALVMVIGLVPASVFAAEPEGSSLADGFYDVNGVTNTMSMWHYDAEDFTEYIEIKDGKITLVTRAYNPNRFDSVWMGKRTEAPENAETAAVITGTLIKADDAYVESGAEKSNILEVDGVKYKAVEFRIPLTEADLTSDIYYVLRYRKGYTNSNGEDRSYTWCGTSNQSFKLGTLSPSQTELELAITNNTSMFKLVSADAFVSPDGSGKIVFALSGASYHNLFKGNYEQAVANGDNRDKWIKGAENAEGKWEFEVPFAAGETYIPLVSISETYLKKYDDGVEGATLARAFYPRQLTIDLGAKTVVADDYKFTQDLKVTNNVKMFKLESVSQLYTVGGPNSNGYKSELILQMSNNTFDKAFIGRSEDAVKEGAALVDFKADGDKGSFTFDVRSIKTPGDPSTTVSLIGEPFVISFHSAKGWYERIFTINETAGTLVVDPVATADIKAAVSVRGEVKLALKDVTAKDIDLDGKVTAKEALIATHEAYYKGGAAEGFATAEGQWGESITKLWGDENKSIMYYRNNASCYSLADEFAKGDVLYAYTMKDEAGYSDAFGKMDKTSYTAEKGTLDITLQTVGFDSDWNPVDKPAPGANISIWAEEAPATRAEGVVLEVVDNEDGTYSLTFNKAGDFVIVATNPEANMVPALASVTVEKAYTAPKVVVSFEVYDADTDTVALLYGPKAAEYTSTDNGKTIAEKLLGKENVGITDSGWMQSFTIDEVVYSPEALELANGSWLVYKNNANDSVGPAEYKPADGDVYRFVLTTYDPVTYAMPVLANDMDALYWAVATTDATDLTSANALIQKEAPKQSDIDAMAVSLSKAGGDHYVLLDGRTVQVNTTTYPYTYFDTLKVDKASAAKDETVTVTLIAPEGTDLVEGSLKANGAALTKKDDTTYTFTMPDAHVSITAEFESADSTKLLTAAFALDEAGKNAVATEPAFDKDVFEYAISFTDQDVEEEGLFFTGTFDEESGTTAKWMTYMSAPDYGIEMYVDGPAATSGQAMELSQPSFYYPGMSNGFKHRLDVTSAAGTINQYFFKMTMLPTLDTLEIDGEEIDGFAYDKYSYDITMPVGTEKITINAVPYDEDTYYVYLNDGEEDIASADTEVALKPGMNTVKIVVDDDGGTTNTYTLNVKVEVPKTLKNLAFKAGTAATATEYELTPEFDPAVSEYTFYLPDSSAMAYAFAELGDNVEGAVTFEYKNPSSGAAITRTLGANGNVSLSTLAASNSFVGQDVTVKIGGEAVYTVHVLRQATLAAGTNGFSIKLADDTALAITPAYNRTVYEYDAFAANDAVFTVAAKPTVTAAALKIDGKAAEAGVAAEVKPVWTDRGFDLIVEVSGEGAKTGVYTFHIHEAAAKLEVTKAPTKTVYAIGEKFDPAGMEVTATYADGKAVTAGPESFTFAPDTELHLKDTVITVSYAGLTAEQKISFTTPFDGAGTEDDPFQIKTAADMQTFDEMVEAGESFEGTFLKMMNDITLDAAFNGVGFGNNQGGTTAGYNANTCKGFSGDFDGGKFTLTVAEGGRAPFDLIRNGSVHDLTVFGKKIADNGVVSTYIANGGTVELTNVTLKSGSSTLKSGMIGGYGNNPITIDGCVVEEGVTVGYAKDQLWIGGIAGEFNGTITNSTCNAEVYGVMFVGGIVADKGQSMQKFEIDHCTFGGKVVASGEGFVLDDYPNKGMVKNYIAGAYAGGIAGAGYGGTQWGMNTAWSTPGVTITNCTVTGTVTGTSGVGGILGGEGAQAQAWDNGHTVIQNNTFTGKVSGEKYVGGIIGYMFSLNKNSDISGNTYAFGSAEKGIGGVGGIDTNGVEIKKTETGVPAEDKDGVFYFCTEVDEDDKDAIAAIRDAVPGHELQSALSIATLGSAGFKNQWKVNHHRTDDPLGKDADALAKMVAAREDLAITNKLNMFKLVSAYIETTGEGKTLVFALSGSSYHYLYQGNYEEAVANGEKRENWIAGEVNAEGKWEFRIPVTDETSYIPVVAISQTYLDKHDQGQNSLERSFYPRQLTLDLAAKTIVADDYNFTKELAVTNNVRMFKVEPKASLTTIGGPNSNGYKSEFTLNMSNATFDKAFIGSAKDAAAEGAEVIEFVPTEDSKGSFTFVVRSIKTPGDPSTTESLLGKQFTISFHSVSKNEWYERVFLIDEEAATVVIESVFTATVTGISLDLQDKISVQFKIQPDDNLAYAELELQNPDGTFEEPVKVVLDKADTSVYKAAEDKFVIRYSEITTRMITQGVKLTVYDKSGNAMNIYRTTNEKTYTNSDPLIYSAADWCNAAIEKYGTDKTQKAAWLAMAVLNLGGEAQKYFENYNPENPANPKGYLADDMAAFKKDAAYDLVLSDANAKQKGYSGITLDLAEETRLRVKFKANVAATVDGKAGTLIEEGGKYVLDITGLRCIDLDQFFEVQFKGTDGSTITMKLCALSWSNAAIDALGSDANNQTVKVAKAVALYSAAAENYFK